MTGSLGQSLIVSFIFLAGLATGFTARWLDQRLDILLDQGVLEAFVAPRVPEASTTWNPALEIGTVLLLGLVAATAESWERMVAGMGLSAALILCAWIDWRNHILPDVLLWPLLVTGVLLAAEWCLFVDVGQAFCGILLGYGMTSLVQVLGTGLCGRLGGGDVKLLAAIGAWFGPVAVTIIFLVSSFLMMVFLMCRRKEGCGALAPFGPVIATSTILYLLYISGFFGVGFIFENNLVFG
ncbi:MAG TPA: A24 family peptidase [Telmatospirillum sp.]|nr:A24 family peptidase [Telmatospirillum sp.]